MIKQKTKYFILTSLTIMLIIIYMIDRNHIKSQIKDYETDISVINSALLRGSNIMDEVNAIRENYTNNINMVDSYTISGSELIDEIQNIKALADKLKISINDLEIDPKNTLPNIFKAFIKDQIQLERQTLSFKLSGDFLDIGNFIEMVENSKSPLRLNYCSISLDTLDPRGVIAQLKYVAYGSEEL